MDNPTISDADTQALIKWLKVVGEPNRVLILEQIIQSIQCNCELGSALQIPANLISHHLGVLKDAGLVNVRRDAWDARWVYYSINIAALDEMVSLFGRFFDPNRIRPVQVSCGPKLGVLKVEPVLPSGS
jgi:ArsR family transcriptional regulator